jgi:hypothetical protein
MHTHDDDDDDDDYGDLFDITRNKHGGEQYSVAANADAAPTKAKLRALVYAYIYAQGVRGATRRRGCRGPRPNVPNLLSSVHRTEERHGHHPRWLLSEDPQRQRRRCLRCY